MYEIKSPSWQDGRERKYEIDNKDYSIREGKGNRNENEKRTISPIFSMDANGFYRFSRLAIGAEEGKASD